MSNHKSSSIRNDDNVAHAAAEWIVRLSVENPVERDAVRVDFEAWKRADPRHASVAAKMERFIDQACSLRKEDPDGETGAGNVVSVQAARTTLTRVLAGPVKRPAGNANVKGRVKRVVGLLALSFVLGTPAILALRVFPPSQLLADLCTSTGEQRSHVLADGTRLTLGTSSALNYILSPDLRRIDLISGEILVDVARDASRPFVVETAHGRIRALGTRFIVRRNAASTLLTMIESKTAVSAGITSAAEIKVGAGQQISLSDQGFEILASVNPSMAEDAFLHRRLLVQDRPLPEVLDELARHRSGLIRYEREKIEHVRVSAVLPLDDTDRALQLLMSNFPQLRVRTITPWMVLVDSAH